MLQISQKQYVKYVKYINWLNMLIDLTFYKFLISRIYLIFRKIAKKVFFFTFIFETTVFPSKLPLIYGTIWINSLNTL